MINITTNSSSVGEKGFISPYSYSPVQREVRAATGGEIPGVATDAEAGMEGAAYWLAPCSLLNLLSRSTYVQSDIS